MGKYPYVLDRETDAEEFRNSTWQDVKASVENDFSLQLDSITTPRTVISRKREIEARLLP